MAKYTIQTDVILNPWDVPGFAVDQSENVILIADLPQAVVDDMVNDLVTSIYAAIGMKPNKRVSGS